MKILFVNNCSNDLIISFSLEDLKLILSCMKTAKCHDLDILDYHFDNLFNFINSLLNEVFDNDKK